MNQKKDDQIVFSPYVLLNLLLLILSPTLPTPSILVLLIVSKIGLEKVHEIKSSWFHLIHYYLFFIKILTNRFSGTLFTSPLIE